MYTSIVLHCVRVFEAAMSNTCRHAFGSTLKLILLTQIVCVTLCMLQSWYRLTTSICTQFLLPQLHANLTVTGDGLKRVDFRTLTWDVAFAQYVKQLETEKHVIFAGDLNAAHEVI